MQNKFIAQLVTTGKWFDGRAFLAVNHKNAKPVPAESALDCAKNFSLVYGIPARDFRVVRMPEDNVGRRYLPHIGSKIVIDGCTCLLIAVESRGSGSTSALYYQFTVIDSADRSKLGVSGFIGCASVKPY